MQGLLDIEIQIIKYALEDQDIAINEWDIDRYCRMSRTSIKPDDFNSARKKLLDYFTSIPEVD